MFEDAPRKGHGGHGSSLFTPLLSFGVLLAGKFIAPLFCLGAWCLPQANSPDLTAWQKEEPDELVQRMENNGVKPGLMSFNVLIDACARVRVRARNDNADRSHAYEKIRCLLLRCVISGRWAEINLLGLLVRVVCTRAFPHEVGWPFILPLTLQFGAVRT